MTKKETHKQTIAACVETRQQIVWRAANTGLAV